MMLRRTIISLGNNRRISTAVWPSCQQSIPAGDETIDGSNGEELIDKKRNKSRLKIRHFNKFHQLPQPLTEDEEQVYSLSYQRQLYGRYGAASGIDPAKAWPSKEELELIKEWEAVAYPQTVHEMIGEAKRLKKEEEEKIKKRQADLLQKAAKLEDWKREVRTNLEKRQTEAIEAKEKKERLMEEVRQIFGFRIDPKDERFKEALLKKEKEEKKAAKEAKRIEKQQKMMANLRKAVKDGTKQESSASSDGLHGKSIVENVIPPSPVESKE